MTDAERDERAWKETMWAWAPHEQQVVEMGFLAGRRSARAEILQEVFSPEWPHWGMNPEMYKDIDNVGAFIREFFSQVEDCATWEERGRCAKIAAEMWPRGSAHTYASENADHYLALEQASERIAAAIRGDGDE